MLSTETAAPPTISKSTIKTRPMLLAAGLCALLTLPVAWNYRQDISSDGVSYLEMAADAAHLSPQYLFTNAYWSPAYPGLLTIALKLTHPLVASELAIVHAVDWIICAAAYLAFGWFLLNLLKWLEIRHGPLFTGSAGFYSLLFFAYSLVYVSNLDGSLWLVGPNILMEGSVYMVAAGCLRLSLPGVRLYHCVLFGLSLAFAYSAKTVLLPLSLILFAILFVWPLSREVGRRGIVIAAVTLLLGVSPLIAALSYAKGRFTMGDTGRLNYAWYVNDIPRSDLWNPSLPGAATLRHLPRRIPTTPVTLKFDGPGSLTPTYSYWYDPSWWYEGLQSRFNLRQQLQQILRSLGLAPKVMLSGSTVFQLAQRWLPLLAGTLALALLGLRVRSLFRVVGKHFWLFLWPLAAGALFACVLIEYRYIVPFAVLWWTTLFVAAWVAVRHDRSIGIVLTVALTLLISYVPDFARDAARNQKRLATWSNPAVARNLNALGIRPGDELVSINLAEASYYARLVGARFDQELWTDDLEALASLSETEVRQLIGTLRENGAKALFSAGRPGFVHDTGWVRVTETMYVRMLR